MSRERSEVVQADEHIEQYAESSRDSISEQEIQESSLIAAENSRDLAANYQPSEKPELQAIGAEESPMHKAVAENELITHMQDETNAVKEAEIDSSASFTAPEIVVEKIIPDSVIFTFEIYPWAKIFCDGAFLGNTPVFRKINIDNTQHRFRFEHPGFPPLFKDFDPSQSDSISFIIDLRRESVRLEFKIDLWAYLFIDDNEYGTIPTRNPIYITPGNHQIRFHHPEFEDVTKHISVSAGDSLLLPVYFLK